MINFNKILKDKVVITYLSISLLMFIYIVFSCNFTTETDKLMFNATSIKETLQGYKVLINDQQIGIVESKDTVENMTSQIKSELENTKGLNVSVNKSLLNFQKTSITTTKFTPLDKLYENLKKNLKFMANCYSININGENIVFLKTKADAEKVINEIKSLYLPKEIEKENYDLEYIKILEDIEIKEVEADVNSIMTNDNAKKYLLQGTTEEKKYKVQKGDSLWVIAKNNNMTVEDIIKANPNINPTLIHIGDELNLIVPKPYLNVEVKYTYKYKESIPYDTVVKKDSSLERTKWIVKKNGKSGKKEVTAEITIKNGLIENRKIIDKKILSEPVTQIVLKGTKRTYEDELASAFLPEGTGVLTSRFGMRWGRHHDGIDYGVPVGTPVYALMEGTVKFSGWKSGYGYIVILEHANGYETYYAHNSKLLVKKGDKVSKRQTIAYSGNTGRSTGPHVHFEIHKDGKLLNPLDYLKKHYK
ncbi:M23 family metallopeptidase [Caldisalinibacter kiritimatiensis]|uniref:Peptidoglycan-binding LysM n=1 Tax=Caldisalinibacter kiritimatiensis TaxID=1304284 RepID=R1CQ37_9FIRM|nr:M23 family metallopeptidase [Caldisalinibacter kiritimatiensis]EOD00796.1 Peptidoglycan-binding LysM [Caldisalinibacter kiritimatiensis]